MSDPVQERAEAAHDPVATLRDPAMIRDRAHRLLHIGLDGGLSHFSIHMVKMDAAAELVASVIRANYPALNIPYHGRWRHFAANRVDRWGMMKNKFTDKEEMIRAAIDLAVVSVLLDAGAGAQWAFQESGVAIARSEGLAVASFHMFRDGLFSSDPARPWRVDAAGLERLKEKSIAEGFQVSPDNPMTGLAGRTALLKRLAAALRAHPDIYGAEARPGHLFDAMNRGKTVDAADILGTLLETLSPIWPGRLSLRGQNLGDTWRHSKLAYPDETSGLMPFHKLSQWLTYSLLEPFEWAGLTVTGLDKLTGLPEYRNGGLFLDGGVLELKEPGAKKARYEPGDELIVEWRALTVALLDELRVPVAEKLGLDLAHFPLARLLEGGTWAAGRKLAFARTRTGDPPLQIASDGTVF
jgi:hypothetical protein